jgi:hypothetical protein
VTWGRGGKLSRAEKAVRLQLMQGSPVSTVALRRKTETSLGYSLGLRETHPSLCSLSLSLSHIHTHIHTHAHMHVDVSTAESSHSDHKEMRGE